MSQFLTDVVKGLSFPKKYLESKYFYDAKGDALFMQIMHCPEYYLTNCEMEIFTQQTSELAYCVTNGYEAFDLVELGAGDATKSIFLLQQLVNNQVNFTYYPVDISKNVITLLQNHLPTKIPSLKIQGLNGEYFSMLNKARKLSDHPKVVLFLGANIGNVTLEHSNAFCSELRSHLNPGDMVMIGFDLTKEPQVILDAYNDKAGYTSQFNLNLLTRINRELSGNFQLNNFSHFAVYNPETGTCKSYLVSAKEQQVEVADHHFHFAPYEAIFMEVSQKYTLAQTNQLATNNGFEPVKNFFDKKSWFVDAVWKCV